MLSVTVIGSGNVAQHLIRAFSSADGVTLQQVYARNPTQFTGLVPDAKIAQSTELLPADLYIIAVSDAAVEQVSRSLQFSGRLVAHTSGSAPIDILDNANRKAVFYPLQTFSKSKDLNYREIPLFIEAENAGDIMILENAAKTISDHVFRLDSEGRKSLHIAAVFASNFTNHMYALAANICSKENIPFEMLNPLIRETADKVGTLDPFAAQTGPAVRGDQVTIDSHLEAISDENTRNIYKIISNSIRETKKL